MHKDHARMTVLMDAQRKQEFDLLCQRRGTTSSEVVRQLIQDYLEGKRPLKSLLESRPGKKAPPIETEAIRI